MEVRLLQEEPQYDGEHKRITQVQALTVCTDAEVESERKQTSSHKLIIILVCANYIQLDLASILLYLLLASSSVGCSYVHVLAKMKLILLSFMLGWRPVSGWLIDAYARHQHFILLTSCVLEMLLLTAMMVIGLTMTDFSPWLVLGLNIVKQAVEVMMYNSVWKILKMRLEHRFQLKCGTQCSVLSGVGIMGEGIELVFNLGATLGGYLLITRAGANFAHIRILFFAAACVSGFVCVAAAWYLVLHPHYFQPSKEDYCVVVASDEAPQGTSADSPAMAPPSDSTASDEDGDDPPAANIDAEDLFGSDSEESLPDTEDGRTSFHKQQHHHHHHAGFCGRIRRLGTYVFKSTSYIMGNTVARGMLTHQLLVYIPYSIANNFEYFSVPGRHMNHEAKTMDNFCDGYITNTVYQDSILNIVYIAGVLFYWFVFKRILPSDYFKIWYVVFAVGVGGIYCMVYFHLSQTVLAIALSTGIAMGWFLFVYDNYVAVAAVSHKLYGFYGILNGYIQSGVDLAVYGAVYYKVATNLMLGISFTMMGLSVAYALWFGWGKAHALKQASRGYC